MAFTLKSGSENKYLEEKFVTWDEVGLTGPNQTPGLVLVAGTNSYGELGLGNRTYTSFLTQFSTSSDWKYIEGGNDQSFFINSNNNLYVCGNNTDGSLGLGDTTHRSSPVQVGSLTNWKQVSSGISNTSPTSVLAVKTDGTLWAWGTNGTGELGLGDRVHRSSPVQVGSLTNWKQVATSTGNGTVAIKTDGTLWAWGYYTVAGQNNFTSYSSPVQVGSLTNWKYVTNGSGSIGAIKADGTLWSWGSNILGQLGLGDRTAYSSPVQVGTLTNWKTIEMAYYYFASAIKTDGTLWTWGYNQTGQLGQGDRTHRSSPVQVGSLTNWKQINSGYAETYAVKTDGTMWGWGLTVNSEGLYPNSVSSPVQVGSLNKWKSASAGRNSLLATQYNY